MDHDQICTYFVKKIQMSQFEMILKLSVQLVFSIQKKRSLLSSSPCYLSLEKVHTMAFTIVAHAGQHGLSCRCELHSKAGQRDARVSAASMKPQEEIIMMLSLLLKNASLLMRIMENRHLQYHVMLDCKSSYVKQAFG